MTFEDEVRTLIEESLIQAIGAIEGSRRAIGNSLETDILAAHETDKQVGVAEAVQAALDHMEWRIDCDTGLSEMYGWKSTVAQAKYETEKKFLKSGKQGGSE